MNLLGPKKFQRQIISGVFKCGFLKHIYGHKLDRVTSGILSVSQSGDPSESSQPVYPYVGVCCRIQGDQKVSVHLTITVQHQVHRDILITLYFLTIYCKTTTLFL